MKLLIILSKFLSKLKKGDYVMIWIRHEKYGRFKAKSQGSANFFYSSENVKLFGICQAAGIQNNFSIYANSKPLYCRLETNFLQNTVKWWKQSVKNRVDLKQNHKGLICHWNDLYHKRSMYAKLNFDNIR